MRSNRGLSILTLILVSSLAVLTLYAWTIPLKIEQKRSDGRLIQLDDPAGVEQSYRAHYSGVSRISVQVSSAFEDPQVLRLILTQIDDGHHEVVDVQGAGALREGNWIDFDLPSTPPFPAGEYTFRITQEGGKSLSLAATEQDMYPEGEVIDSGGDLVFEIAFNPSIAGVFTGLAAQLSAHKPGLLGLPISYLLLLAGLCTAFGGFTYRLFQHIMENNRPS